MKNSQKLKIQFENYVVVVRFDELDEKLLHIAKKLELNGDEFGPFCEFDGLICICMSYADKRRKGVKEAEIFGYPKKEFLAKQYK